MSPAHTKNIKWSSERLPHLMHHSTAKLLTTANDSNYLVLKNNAKSAKQWSQYSRLMAWYVLPEVWKWLFLALINTVLTLLAFYLDMKMASLKGKSQKTQSPTHKHTHTVIDSVSVTINRHFIPGLWAVNCVIYLACPPSHPLIDPRPVQSEICCH